MKIILIILMLSLSSCYKCAGKTGFSPYCKNQDNNNPNKK